MNWNHAFSVEAFPDVEMTSLRFIREAIAKKKRKC